MVASKLGAEGQDDVSPAREILSNDDDKRGFRVTLLISNDPLAPRQRLADPSKPPPTGRAYLADAGHRIVGRGRIVDAGGGWIALREIGKVTPFRAWREEKTCFTFNPDGPTRETAERPDQRRFRERLMRRHGGKCAVTGCDVPQLLDAAHLRSWRIDDEGALLRADLHRMIDRGLAEIRGGRFHLSPPVSAYVRSAYGAWDGAALRKPRKPRGDRCARTANG